MSDVILEQVRLAREDIAQLRRLISKQADFRCSGCGDRTRFRWACEKCGLCPDCCKCEDDKT